MEIDEEEDAVLRELFNAIKAELMAVCQILDAHKEVGEV